MEKRPLVNILIIEKRGLLCKELTRSLNEMLPSKAKAVYSSDLASGIRDIRDLGNFHIIVLGSTATHTDGITKLRLDLLRKAARRNTKLVLFAGSAPRDPLALEVDGIAIKPNIPDLAKVLTLLIQNFGFGTFGEGMRS